jgi:hypothetical protein
MRQVNIGYDRKPCIANGRFRYKRNGRAAGSAGSTTCAKPSQYRTCNRSRLRELPFTPK